MGGGPLYVLLSFTAFGVGYLPGLLVTWLVLRRHLVTRRWHALGAVALARFAVAIVAGALFPLTVAVAGLVLSYPLDDASGRVALAVLGGWVTDPFAHWLATLALVAAWACYGVTFAFAAPLEAWLQGLLEARMREPPLSTASARGLKLAYALQALVAVCVWWEIHAPPG